MKKARFVKETQTDLKGRSRLRQVTYAFEDGTQHGYDIYDMRATMQMSAGVLPLDDEGNVYLVEEFLPALGEFGLSLPRGGIEVGEEPEVTARRELKEEAGLACDRLEPLWSGMVIPNGSSWTVHLFVGRGVREVVREGGDEIGGVRTVKLPLEDVRAMVKDGRIQGALVALAVAVVDR